MLNIKIIAIGTKMPEWIGSGYQEYAKRLNKYCKLTLIELPVNKRAKTSNKEIAIQAESEAILAKVNPQDYVVALEITGKEYSTEKLASFLEATCLKTSSICIIIGGPDGFNKACLDRADAKLSLSKLTLPHPLVRVVLAEQLYRAFSLINNHPYHK